MARLAYYFDSSKCVGCHGCQTICKQWNQEKAVTTLFTGSLQNPPTLDTNTRMIMRYYENFETESMPSLNFLKYQCFHCGEPACVKVCPSGALTKSETGIVGMDTEKCIACGYCHNACPFSIPMVGKTVNKCDMCQSRTKNGSSEDKTETPACVKTCPAGALEFGDRDKLIAKANKRVEILQARGNAKANLYGENVLGGLGIISVLKYPPDYYELPANPSIPLEVTVWKDYFNPLGLLMLGGAMGMAAFLHFLALKQPKDGDHHHNETADGKGKENTQA
jgi:formate dehydrogenase beta subunit